MKRVYFVLLIVMVLLSSCMRPFIVYESSQKELCTQMDSVKVEFKKGMIQSYGRDIICLKFLLRIKNKKKDVVCFKNTSDAVMQADSSLLPFVKKEDDEFYEIPSGQTKRIYVRYYAKDSMDIAYQSTKGKKHHIDIGIVLKDLHNNIATDKLILNPKRQQWFLFNYYRLSHADVTRCSGCSVEPTVAGRREKQLHPVAADVPRCGGCSVDLQSTEE